MTAVGQRDFEDWSYGGESLYLAKRDGENSVDWSGYFIGENGIVGIWAASYGTGRGWTSLTVVAHGRQHHRRWPRAWHRRTLPRLCRRFLADLAEQ